MDIYLIKCTVTGKGYVGQCNQILSNGKLWGYKKRYVQHIYSSKNGSSNCSKLKNSILKYGENNHTISLITVCLVEEVDEKEIYYINLYQTLHPNGLNLETGGNKHKQLSQETKQKMSLSRMGHPNYLKDDSGVKISNGLISHWEKNPKDKVDHNGKQLPKYISPIFDNNDIIGYSAFIHHNNKRKKITSSKLTLDDKLIQIQLFIKEQC